MLYFCVLRELQRQNVINLNEIISSIIEIIPADLEYLKNDFEKHTKSVLAEKLDKMEIVTQEEFDIQKKVLARTRQKLEKLEAQVAELTENNG